MTPVTFPEANAHFGAPSGLSESQVMAIHAYCGPLTSGSLDGLSLVVTAWKPEPYELAMLNDGLPIFLSFVGGGCPPHFPSMSFEQATHPR